MREADQMDINKQDVTFNEAELQTKLAELTELKEELEERHAELAKIQAERDYWKAITTNKLKNLGLTLKNLCEDPTMPPNVRAAAAHLIVTEQSYDA
jgi:hypothetical protein